jgi:hypothetical protein
MLINGTAVNNSPERYTPMTSLQLIRFDGTRWVGLATCCGMTMRQLKIGDMRIDRLVEILALPLDKSSCSPTSPTR